MALNDTRKSKAIEALGFGLSGADASERAGVSRKTIYRWLELDDFKKSVLERQGEVLNQVSQRLSGLALQGLETLGELMSSENEMVRLRASSAVLSRFVEIIELLRLEKRVEVLVG